MYRFLLTPRWWGINVFAVLAIPFCIFMGSWQLSRFEDRVDTHHQQKDRSAEAKTAAARPLAELLPVDKVTSGRQATATGRYDTAHQLLVPDRELDQRRGFYVLTLLRTDGGKALPVVRGWLPGDADAPEDRAKVPAPPSGAVKVTGALQASENQGTDGVHAGGGLPAGQLGMISAASLVNIVPYDVYDAWITVTDAQAPLRAVPPTAAEGSGLDLKAFQNLGYTGEWFVFAGFVVFMWFRLFRREAEAARDVALGLVPEEGPDGADDGASGEQTKQAERAERAERVKQAEQAAKVEQAEQAEQAAKAPRP
ncbi:SURF1 family protein [Streptomyces albofaciens JCM 4342]|uniref:SURF1 family protein n=1 Tax=Streptomyces albofaciens TaxID=66866 RepID=UPI00123BC078|nr:SURF1 family protein [Streptomyces albofaciens]KAA6214925.1 SURF1 family protein [Streptomyces albofaciens JCM 4342]